MRNSKYLSFSLKKPMELQAKSAKFIQIQMKTTNNNQLISNSNGNIIMKKTQKIIKLEIILKNYRDKLIFKEREKIKKNNY
jgi:hypothetical protein